MIQRRLPPKTEDNGKEVAKLPARSVEKIPKGKNSKTHLASPGSIVGERTEEPVTGYIEGGHLVNDNYYLHLPRHHRDQVKERECERNYHKKTGEILKQDSKAQASLRGRKPFVSLHSAAATISPIKNKRE